MAGLLSSSSLILHHFPLPTPLRHPSSSSTLLCYLLFKPLTTARLPTTPLRNLSSSFTSLSSRPVFFPSPSLTLSYSQTPQPLPPNSISIPQLALEPNIEGEFEDTDAEEYETGDEGFVAEEEEAASDPAGKVSNSSVSRRARESAVKLPSLTVEEKKELASYAQSLGKKLKVQHIGKSGVSESLATAMVENLESNELLKLKILSNCPGELGDVVKQLEEATGSVVVGEIGRTVILYRPSLTKHKAAEKIKQYRRVYKRKEPALDRLRQREGSGRGRRGSSRFVSFS